MRPSLCPSTNAPAPTLLSLLTVLFAVTPRRVHAQPPTPTSTQDPDSLDYLDDYKYLGIALAGIVGLIVLCGCCAFCCNSANRRSSVRDVEGRPATPSGQMQGQEHEAPAPPAKALAKEEVLGIDTAKEWEYSPPPYYPVSRLSVAAKEMEKFTSAMVDLVRFMAFGIGKPPPLPPPPAPALQKAATMST